MNINYLLKANDLNNIEIKPARAEVKIVHNEDDKDCIGLTLFDVFIHRIYRANLVDKDFMRYKGGYFYKVAQNKDNPKIWHVFFHMEVLQLFSKHQAKIFDVVAENLFNILELDKNKLEEIVYGFYITKPNIEEPEIQCPLYISQKF
ncbi:hypothetical protein [Helicobacter cetorum]|uniref:Uncharacterized protein n=1 Tax=Helicobacter cetorum (strain ATCC BAA-429 / MIT 00-7128) TaxID=182217 RepID=I0EME3_HELC0|nr:hypothetical protein [Helicobacter cetorum]AFI04112.1 hypothetical protein HCW_04215 [Helicobacter cetorum MIT 00-7128]